MKSIQLFTDGACKGNPGPGGWGAVLIYADDQKHLYGGEAHTTNNRMELRAAIEGLEALKERCQVALTTDSQYVKNGIQQWMVNWKKNNWRTSNKKPVKNEDLWKALDAAVSKHDVSWHWVKGHSGHPLNDLADELANKGVLEGAK